MKDQEISKFPTRTVSIPNTQGNDTDFIPFVKQSNSGKYTNFKTPLGSFVKELVESEYFKEQLTEQGLGGNPLFSTVTDEDISSGKLSLEFTFTEPTYLIKLWYAYDLEKGTNKASEYYNPEFRLSNSLSAPAASLADFYNASNNDIEKYTTPANRPYLPSFYQSTQGTKTFNNEVSYLSQEPVNYWLLSTAISINVVIGNNATLPSADSNGARSLITQTSSALGGGYFVSAYVKSNSVINSPAQIQWVKTKGNKPLSLSTIDGIADLVNIFGSGTPKRWNPSVNATVSVNNPASGTPLSFGTGLAQWTSTNKDVSGKNSNPITSIEWIVPIYYFKLDRTTTINSGFNLPATFGRMFQKQAQVTVTFPSSSPDNVMVLLYPSALGKLTSVQENDGVIGGIGGVYDDLGSITMTIDGNVSTSYQVYRSKNSTGALTKTKFI